MNLEDLGGELLGSVDVLVETDSLPLAAVLEQTADPRLTNELARFNLEANLTPRDFTGDCLRRMEAEMTELVAAALVERSFGGH